MKRTRIFITTSHISCVYMTLFARATKGEDDTDILLVDTGARREGVVRLIREAASQHPWALVHSFSTSVPDDHGFSPSLRKRLTRRWKEAPGVRGIYRHLLGRQERTREARHRMMLSALLGPLVPSGTPVLLFAHTQTYLQRPLQRLYPGASLAFLEHGLGDYHYIMDEGRTTAPFHALFASGFATFLDRRGIDARDIHPLPMAGWRAMAQDLIRPHTLELEDRHIPDDRKLVLVLVESVEMYEVPDAFWSAYIDHVLSKLGDTAPFHFLLKPHPAADPASLRRTMEHCQARGLSFTLLDAPLHKSMAAEVLFMQWAGRTEHVFCLFSSACFYLSKLHPDPRITYHFSSAFMDRWTGNAPPMYKQHFEALKPLIAEVFSENCSPY